MVREGGVVRDAALLPTVPFAFFLSVLAGDGAIVRAAGISGGHQRDVHYINHPGGVNSVGQITGNEVLAAASEGFSANEHLHRSGVGGSIGKGRSGEEGKDALHLVIHVLELGAGSRGSRLAVQNSRTGCFLYRAKTPVFFLFFIQSKQKNRKPQTSDRAGYMTTKYDNVQRNMLPGPVLGAARCSFRRSTLLEQATVQALRLRLVDHDGSSTRAPIYRPSPRLTHHGVHKVVVDGVLLPGIARTLRSRPVSCNFSSSLDK